jgi:hypothetical protein
MQCLGTSLDVASAIRCFKGVKEITEEDSLEKTKDLHSGDVLFCFYESGSGGMNYVFDPSKSYHELIFENDNKVMRCNTSGYLTAYCSEPLPTSGVS